MTPEAQRRDARIESEFPLVVGVPSERIVAVPIQIGEQRN